MSRLIDADAFEREVMRSDDEDLQDVIYHLRDFPAAQQWIPVTERLPEPSKNELYLTNTYLVQDGYGYMSVAEYRETTKGRKYWEQIYSGHTLLGIVAWMPLPEPYRGDDHDEG